MPITTREQLDLAHGVSCWIKQNPHLHDQTSFRTATKDGVAHCIAGVVVALTPGTRFDDCNCCATTVDGAVDISDFAQERLGLNWGEAFDLFFEYSNDTARAYLDQLIADGSAYLATV
ncbi:hypothetical protein ACWZHB_01225 [Nocardia sp. FBN12]|uniref:hypothetical protein n=1 Tax=Nocardia sp. FBN12 TaxID=3419766 RepID=UPI003D035B57